MPDTNDILEKLRQHKVLPIVSLADAAMANPLADALVAGGLPAVEVTFRTDAAADAIRALAARGDLLVGAGTILRPEQADQAKEAGAQFVVTPGFNAAVVRHCQSIALPIFPGVSSPTDIEMALELGLETVKFFPAEAFGGVATLKAVSAPYRIMRFIPTGGIDAEKVPNYLALSCVVACGGSWMVKASLLESGNYAEIERLAREAVGIAQAT